MSIRLVSFNICPFVQRSAMLLEHLGQDYDIEYIDLNNPPKWFLKISPMGKVPILQVDDTVLFESHVILEYLNEVAESHLHPVDPLEKARHRAMMEFSSAMLATQWMTMAATEDAKFEKRHGELLAQMRILEDSISPAPFYAGETLHMIDFSYAPLLLRLDILQRHYLPTLLNNFPKITAWTQAIMALDALKQSAVPDLEARILQKMIDVNACIVSKA